MTSEFPHLRPAGLVSYPHPASSINWLSVGLSWVRVLSESKSQSAITHQPASCWGNECLNRARGSGMLTKHPVYSLCQALGQLFFTLDCFTLNLCTQKPIVPWKPNSKYHHLLEVSVYSAARSSTGRHNGRARTLVSQTFRFGSCIMGSCLGKLLNFSESDWSYCDILGGILAWINWNNHSANDIIFSFKPLLSCL